MLDFTSALYLGLAHPTAALRPWRQMTTGRPAVLETPDTSRQVAAALASLIGCEAATLCPSTLHVFWDAFGTLGSGHAIYVDAGAYPVAQWGVERAVGRGVGATIVPHYDSHALQRTIGRAGSRARPVVVVDGFCPGCGRSAPIAEYLKAVEDRNGLLVIDDTQALGILGRYPTPRFPYGRGGGGSMCYQGIRSRSVVLIASLAKAFGVPVALLAGTAATVQSFEAHSETRVHTSPPSAAAIHAAAHAVAVNAAEGGTLRHRLGARVAQLKRRLSGAGVSTTGGWFPAQTVNTRGEVDGRELHQRLLKSGIRTVLRSVRRDRAGVTLLVTARHTPREIEAAAAAIASAVGKDVARNARGCHERAIELRSGLFRAGSSD